MSNVTGHTNLCSPGEDFAYVRWVLSEPFRARMIREMPHATYFIAWESTQSRIRMREHVKKALSDDLVTQENAK